MKRASLTKLLAAGLLAAVPVAALSACGSDAELDRTMATLELVRGEATVGEDAVERVARAALTQEIGIAEGSLARLRLDSGAQLLMDAESGVTLGDEATVELTAGRVYAESAVGQELFLTAGQRVVRASDAALSATLDGELAIYVVRGEVSWTQGEARGVAQAGERLTFGDEPSAEAVTLWHDWTGGLAQPGPADARGAAGVGVLEARVPDEVGRARWPLVIRRLDVQVRIVDDLAITEVEQVFFNPASEMVEGLYRVRVPEEAVLQRFAVDRDGRLVDGYVREKAQARQAYERQVFRGSQLDPALLEWVAPGSYSARIYPIRPGETRRIVIRYAEWLRPMAEGGARLYRYPMGAGRDATRIQELSIAVDVEETQVESMRAGMGAAVEGGRVRLRRSDFAPRSDFWLELNGAATGQRAWQAPHEPPPRAPDARAIVGEADERDYWYLPLHLPEALFEDARAEGVDLVIVADVSAATERAHLELGRSVTEALTAHLGEHDRVAIVSSDLTIRPLGEDGGLGDASAERVEDLLDGLARVPAGGATDLGAAIAAAAALLDPTRPGAVVYVGDGAPTVGELEAEGLLERMARLPTPLRLYAVGIGADANLDLLESLTRGGGLALRVEERSGAADAALRVLGHATRPVAQRVTVDVGNGIENVYPRRPVDVVEGEVLSVVGRVREAPPTTVTVRGTIAGEDFEEAISLQNGTTEESTDLRLRWASERLRQLLLEGGQREEVAELGTRYGMITPFTSYYVPSAQELQNMGIYGRNLIDQPDLFEALDHERASGESVFFALALGPLALAGCSFDDSEAAVAPSSGSAALEEAPATEAEAMAIPMAEPAEIGDMGETNTATSADNRYGIEGPTDEAPPPPAAAAMPMPTSPAPTPNEPEVVEEAVPVADQLRALGYAAGGGGGGGERSRRAASGPRRAAHAEGRTREIVSPWGGGDAEGDGNAAPARRRARTRSGGRRSMDMDTSGRDEDATVNDALGSMPDRQGAQAHTLVDGLVNEYFASARGEWGGQTITIRLPATDPAHHARRRCSDAANLSLGDRRELWRERLGAQSGVSGWLGVYRRAIRDCEAPAWRDRRALLSLMIGRAGSVTRMVDVYRLFQSGSARGFLRAAILRRVRSPQDLRTVRGAFGLGNEPDWELVEQILERANGERARVRALRRLAMQYPESFDLKLRLLEALELAEMGPEARRLADQLRADARSDAGVRTAVGEMFLRMGHREEARRVFSEIVEFAPLDELARRRLGDLYRAHGWFEDAYRQYQTLASIRPDDPSALLLLAQAAAGSGRVDEALRLEQRLMETAQPGSARGIARVAQLWTSVRLAKLRHTAREADDDERLEALERRMRRSGVLTSAGDLRATLVWSHPDAQIGLYAGHPDNRTDAALARPLEIAPEYGIEAFDVPEQEDGTYRLEVRRADATSPTVIEAELIVVWHEGREDEVVHVLPLTFSEGRDAYSWTLSQSELAEAR